jgi:hypothetical protein
MAAKIAVIAGPLNVNWYLIPGILITIKQVGWQES